MIKKCVRETASLSSTVTACLVAFMWDEGTGVDVGIAR